MRDRFWIRGWTWLGLLNTVLAVCFGIVIVRVQTYSPGPIVIDEGLDALERRRRRSWRTVAWRIRPAKEFPRRSR